MDTRIEVQEGPNGATAEVVTLIHEGREFSALGAVINHAEGYLVGYVSSDGKSLTKSGGEIICPVQLVGEYRRYYRWSGWVTTYCYRARVGELRYHGRGGGPGMLLRMRAKVPAGTP